MPLWNRLLHSFRPHRVDREIHDELQSHIAEAIENGRDPQEARRLFGSSLRTAEQSRDLRMVPWLESLRADTVFAWRQLKKHRITSAAAILSLGLSIGACIGAFRLIDAMLLRPLPVSDPSRLYAMFTYGLDPGGTMRLGESNEYPQFALMRRAVRNDAELIAVSYAERTEVCYAGDQETEKAQRQFVSGWMFDAFGLQAAIGRLLNESDDLTPRAHPYAVLSYDYWTRRFGRDPKVLGRTFRMDKEIYQIVGVAQEGFTGTEPGTMTDLFLPTMMNEGVTHDDWGWIRTFVRIKPGSSVEVVRDRLQTVYQTVQRERAKGFRGWPKQRLDSFLSQSIQVLPAAGGLSYMRQEYSRPLQVLAALVALVLLIACVNVANLLTGQSVARVREMALRISIGAGRRRLLQLVLVECALIAWLATVVGIAFASWSAPYVIARINPPDNPARLAMHADWRLAGFAAALTFLVTMLFSVVPGLRISGMLPASALRGGHDQHVKRRWMHGLIAVQVAFCCVVLLICGLLVTSFERLVNQRIGFSSDRLLALNVEAEAKQPFVVWDQLAAHIRSLPGVEATAWAGWPLLSGTGSNGFVSVNGAPPGERLAYFLPVSPHWLATMKIPLIDGRDLRLGDFYPGAAIVNESFAKEYFGGANPVGRWFERGKTRLQVVGLVPDARYRNLREPITPTAYIAIRNRDDESMGHATLLIRTAAADPLALAPILRQAVPRTRSEFRVSNLRTQIEINESQTVRERLLANLAIFFAAVALLLAGIGLYGVLDYSVLQRSKEIGIRHAVGASLPQIVRLVVSDIFAMVAGGLLCGAGLALAAGRFVHSLLYGVKQNDPSLFAAAILTILITAAIAAVAPVTRALRIELSSVLKGD